MKLALFLAALLAFLVALPAALSLLLPAFSPFLSLSSTPSSSSSSSPLLLLSIRRFAPPCRPAPAIRSSHSSFFLTFSFPCPSSSAPPSAALIANPSCIASLLLSPSSTRLSLANPNPHLAWTLTFCTSSHSPAGITLDDTSGNLHIVNCLGNLRIVDSVDSTPWQSFLHPIDLLFRGQMLITGSKDFLPYINIETVIINYSTIKCPGSGLSFFVNSSGDARSLGLFRVFSLNSTSSHLQDPINDLACCSSIIDISRCRMLLWLSYNGTQLILAHSCIKNVSVKKSIAFGLHPKAIVIFCRQGRNSSTRGYKFRFRNATWSVVYDWFANNSSISYAICNVCSAYDVCNNLSKNESCYECSCPHSSRNLTSDPQLILSLNKSGSQQGCQLGNLLSCTCGEACRVVHLLKCTWGSEACDIVNWHPLNCTCCAEACHLVNLRKCTWVGEASGDAIKVQGADYVANDSLSTEHFFRSIKQLVNYVSYFKVQNISVKGTSAPAGTILEGGNKRYLLITIGSTVAGLLLLGVTIGLMCVCCKRRRKFKALRDEESRPCSTLPVQDIMHFTFAQLQEASGDFTCKLGVGGFGSVYKGTLFNGSFVAIKQLENAIQGRKEFKLQVALLYSLNHPNLVRVRGFCANDSRRLIISEYMANGSLDAWIFHKPINKLEDKSDLSLSSTALLNWNARFNIALDVAKGLAFLHNSNLIHLDVKPQNILLDDGFAAKLSDYGLSSLMDQDEGYLIMHMRGATGYMAPEWLQHAYATEKSDVYSYGMVLMEMLGGRKNVDLSRERESWYFPLVAARMYKEGKVLEVLDEKLTKSSMGEAECEQAKRLMQIAFWCILENPTKRPDMGSVLLMLQGHQEVLEPPLPSCFDALNVQASMPNHDDNQHFHHDYYNRSGSSSPSCFNISFAAPEQSSAMVAYNSWSRGSGDDQHNDCSLLLPCQD